MSQAKLINTRVFHDIGQPKLQLRQFSHYHVTPAGDFVPIYNWFGDEAENPLGLPANRVVKINRQSVETKAQNGGLINTWNQHIWLSGTISWEKITWEAAELIMIALQHERSTAGRIPGETDDVLYLKVFGNDDPYWLDVVLGDELEFPNLGDKIIAGQRGGFLWKAAVAWDEHAERASTMDIWKYWKAHFDSEHVKWA